MEQCRSDPCVIRVVVDGKEELVLAVNVDGIMIAGADKTCRAFHAALLVVPKYPTNHLGQLT